MGALSKEKPKPRRTNTAITRCIAPFIMVGA